MSVSTSGPVLHQRARSGKAPVRGVADSVRVLPAVVLVAGAFLAPIAYLVYLSFTTPETGMGNYLDLWKDETARTIILRTIKMAAIVTVVTFLASFPYAYVMTVVGPKARAVMMAFALMPFWTSLMARNFAWIVLMQESGPIDDLMRGLGFGQVTLLGTSTGVTIAMAQVMMPFFTLPLYATLKGIDRRLVDAALGLGDTPVGAFFRVYLPLAAPGILAGATMVFIISLGFYVTPALVGSPRESMLAQLLGSKIDPLFQVGPAGALSVVGLAITLLLLGLVALALRSRGGISTVGGSR
jgi:putative spermidine/putrescine transport system permease protein